MSDAAVHLDTVPAPPPAVLFGIRPGRASDHAFIVSSWLGGDKYSPAGRDMGAVYVIEHEITVYMLLARLDVEVRVAHAPDDDDAILGWAVCKPTSPAVVFYAYTKRDARKLGIASSLLDDLRDQRVEYTHRPVIKARLPLPAGWTYNPVRNLR